MNRDCLNEMNISIFLFNLQSQELDEYTGQLSVAIPVQSSLRYLGSTGKDSAHRY